MKIVLKGGAGSGHWGHVGRARQVGGSLPGTVSMGSVPKVKYWPEDDHPDHKKISKLMHIPDEQLNDKFVSAIQKMYNIKSGTMHSTITSLAVDGDKGGQVFVSGKIFDTLSGTQVGYFKRMIYRDGDATCVYHDWLEINPHYRETGFGSTFYQHNEDTYMKMGFDKIKLQAALAVGGYVWAKLGFDFEDSGKRDNLLEKAEGIWERRYDTPFPNGIKHAWQLASLVGHDGFRIGKESMLGSDWYGYKNLKPTTNNVQVAVGDAYYNSKRYEKRMTKK